MKILCLHGRNQNGQIFREQLGTAIKMIEDSETGVSFDFPDAPKQCAGSPSDEQTIYKFFDAPSTAEICEQFVWLQSKLEADGPYDGVIAFCQGATLVSNYLLLLQGSSDKESPFKFATFISASIPLDMLGYFHVFIPVAAVHIAREMERRREQRLGSLPSHVARARQAMYDSDDCFGLNLNMIQPELKFRIPTAHIWGENDPGFPSSIQLAGLCDPYLRKTYSHNAGREVPRTEEGRQELGQLVLWCMQRATWPGQLQAQ
ncbi:serine hydrolase FSH [Xylaria acuta]|nr:serine hydrolase FSH [Xylaria acuta]